MEKQIWKKYTHTHIYMVVRSVVTLTTWITIGSNMFHKMIHNFHKKILADLILPN
jgi:hypothetical protein